MNPILTGELILTHKETVATDTIKFKFKATALKTLAGDNFEGALFYTPGQFVSLGFTKTAWRAYSVASIPSEEEIELVVRIVSGGVGSEALNAANVGDSFPFKGPFGHFKISDNEHAHLVFCATGTGIAPFRSMIKAEQQSESPREMTLLYGGKNADDLAYLEDLNEWSADLKVKLGLSQDPDLKVPSTVKCEAQHCRITQLLENLELSDQHEFYLCGNGAMVKSVQEILEILEVDKTRIFMERFN